MLLYRTFLSPLISSMCFVVPIKLCLWPKKQLKLELRYFWLQLDIVNEEAGRIASDAGLEVIMDRCIKVEDAILNPRNN